MSQIQELTLKLQRELYSKNAPGEVLLNLREKWLEKFLVNHSCNVDALMLGFMLADFKLQESLELRRVTEHIRMSNEYAVQAFERYNEIPVEDQKIVLEIIDTHHGGNHIYLESKLFKNADAMAFLEPKGWMHLFGASYEDHGEFDFSTAIKKVDEKIEEKFSLVDLDEETIAQANIFKEKYDWLRARI